VVDIVAIHTWAAYVFAGAVVSIGGIFSNNIPHHIMFGCMQNVDIDTVMNIAPTIHKISMLKDNCIDRK
jgi:riboflavin transporter FmnP